MWNSGFLDFLFFSFSSKQTCSIFKVDFKYVSRVYLGLRSHILTNISNNKTEYYPVQGCTEAVNNIIGNPQIVQILGETESALFEKTHYFGIKGVWLNLIKFTENMTYTCHSCFDVPLNFTGLKLALYSNFTCFYCKKTGIFMLKISIFLLQLQE